MAGQICPIFEKKEGDNLSLIGAWMLHPVNLKIIPDEANFMELRHIGPMLSSYIKKEPCRQVENKETNVGNGVVFLGGAFIMGHDNKAPNEKGAISNLDCLYILKSNNGVAILIREKLQNIPVTNTSSTKPIVEKKNTNGKWWQFWK